MEYIDNTDVSGKDSGMAICCSNAGASIKSFLLFDPNTKQMTISFYLKTCTGCHGVIFSYKKQKPFSLDFIDDKIVIYYGKYYEWNTNITLSDNIWYQIVFTYSKRDKFIRLYVLTENTDDIEKPLMKYYQIEKFDYPNPFKNDGKLSFGKFQISQEIKKWKKADKFVGCYDTFGIANK